MNCTALMHLPTKILFILIGVGRFISRVHIPSALTWEASWQCGLASRTRPARGTKKRLCGKILLSHVCRNPCRAPALQTPASNTSLGTGFQSAGFISPVTPTVSLQVQQDRGQPLCCGSKRWKSFPSL